MDMISEKQLVSIFKTPYHRFFENGSPHPAGDLLGIGIGLPMERNHYHDTRGMWSYPYYTFTIMIRDSVGSYHNENGFQCELAPGNFFFTFPGVKQQYSPVMGKRWGELYVCFAGTIFDVIREQNIITPQRPVWHLRKPEPWVKRLLALAQKPTASTPQGNLGRAVHFLDYLIKMLEAAKPVLHSESTLDWFGQACQLLTNDLHHKIDLHSIADELSMSYHTFRIYFTRRAGVSPMLYRDQARIKRACKYLSETPIKSCQEIAFVVGYSCPQRFSEQFRLHVGMTPIEFRKQYLRKMSTNTKAPPTLRKI